MSTQIRPNDIEEWEEGTVRRYELPKEGETVFWTDTSGKAYSVTWEVSDEFGVESFADFLKTNFDESDLSECLAAFDGADERFEGSLEEVRSREEYPSECTYLRVEAPRFDMDWLRGSYVNRLAFSSSPQYVLLFEEVFGDLTEQYNEAVLNPPYQEGIEEVKQVVAEDGEHSTELEI